MGMYPRWIQADKIYAQTQRTIDRQFFFVPDPVTRNIIGASAVRAQQAHPVHIYWLDFNINHEQNGIAPLSDSFTDLNNVVLFKQTFHRILVFELNGHLGREGGMFSTPPRTIPCLDNPSVEQQFFYALTNPVKDGLVDRLDHWKGFSSYPQLGHGIDEVFTWSDRTKWHNERKKHALTAYRKSGRIVYTPIPSLAHMKPHKRESYIRREVKRIEDECREQRAKNKQKVMTPARLAKVDHRDRPAADPERTPMPKCHSSCPELARQYECQLFEFLAAYCQASEVYRAGNWDTVFPRGSYKPPLIVIAA